MSLSIGLACLWWLVAAAAGMTPVRHHRLGAWALIVTGVPLVGLVTLQNGPLLGLLALAAGFMALSMPGSLLRASARPSALLRALRGISPLKALAPRAHAA